MIKRAESDAFRDHCGVVGIFGNDEAAKLAYLALYALQHRGQDSAGIVAAQNGQLVRQIGRGLVSEVFTEKKLNNLNGTHAVGHVRYTTAGSVSLIDAQPLLAKTWQGPIAVAHNGNLIDQAKWREQLEREGAIFQTTSDTEVICHLLAKSRKSDVVESLREALQQINGAYSLCLATPNAIIGVRDPYGIRPLVLGKLKSGYVLASEDCAFDLLEAERIREVEPGEILVIDEHGLRSEQILAQPLNAHAQCIFEHVYFARPDSMLFGVSVHAARKAMGARLAKEAPVEADAVIAVPDSGVIAAMGYAQATGIAFETGLVRNHYVGRTFIEPESRIRHFGVRLKLSPIAGVVKNRRLVVVDDSIVRGTTSRKIVAMIKASGAREVHLRVTAPMTRHPCFYGIDTPKKEELIASQYDLEGIRQYLGVDSLAYLSLEGLHQAYADAAQSSEANRLRTRMCDACFSGNYPIAIKRGENAQSAL